MFVGGVVVLGVVSALVLRGRPVDVLVPHPVGQAEASCDALDKALPRTVAGQGRHAVSPPSNRTAAWGDDPIVLRCGVGTPAALQPTSELTTVDGVDWLPETLEGASRFTTVGRIAYVEVTVPDSYATAADALVDLGPAIRATDAEVPSDGS